jgi:hypothetical protein
MTQVTIGKYTLDQDAQNMLCWHMRDEPVSLWLDMSDDAKYPWRTSIFGEPLRSKWSTPYVAIMRTMGKLERGVTW